MRLERGMGYLGAIEAVLTNVVRLRKTGLHVSEMMMVFPLDVVRPVIVDQIVYRQHRCFGIEIGWQDLVIDTDQSKGFFRDPFRLRRHAGHVVANVANLVDGENGLIVTDGEYAVLHRRVQAAEHGVYAGQAFRRRGVDGANTRVGMRAVQDPAYERAGQQEIIRVPAGARHLVQAIYHGDARADQRTITTTTHDGKPPPGRVGFCKRNADDNLPPPPWG